MADQAALPDGAEGAYVFRVRFSVSGEGVHLEPATFETTLFRPVDPPGEAGWLFFRDNLWRGEAGDPDHLRETAAETLGVEVLEVSFAELRTTSAHLDVLRQAIADDLGAFRADTVDEVLSNYLGSSIRVVD